MRLEYVFMHPGYLRGFDHTLFNLFFRKPDIVGTIGDLGPNAAVKQLVIGVLEYVANFGDQLFDDALLLRVQIINNDTPLSGFE